MHTYAQHTLAAFALIAVFAFSIALPLAAHAQDATNDELRTVLRAAISGDARSENMTESQIDAMIEALVRQANAAGVTVNDVKRATTGNPAPATQASAQGNLFGARPCGSLLCTLNQAFGFDGSDMAIPIGLGVTSALLLFLIGALLLHGHGHHPISGKLGTPASSNVTYGS